MSITLKETNTPSPNNIIHYSLSIITLLLTLLSLHGQESGTRYAEAALASRHLIPGEETYLVLRLRGAQPDSRPTPPSIPGTAVNFVRTIPELNAQNRITQAFLYRITPSKPGKITIPPITLTSGGKPYKTEPLHIEVRPTSSLICIPTGIHGQNVRAAWFPTTTSLYPGEQSPLTLKIYVPEKLSIVSWGLPDPEKTNCLAWRFSLPEKYDHSRVSIHGIPHISTQYSTTLSGISPGRAAFGPCKLRLIVRQSIIDPRIGPRTTDTPVHLTLPVLALDITPFPAGAPADFHGAVGQFQIDARCEKLSLSENDSTEVTLRVAGTGNLENINAPILSAQQWKIIDTSKVTRGEERRYISGMVTFRQLLRPVGTPENIPAYTFSYFNPMDKTFHTLETPPIPVRITPSANKPASTPEVASTPTDEMRGILGFINHVSVENSQQPSIRRTLHLLPALIALLIIGVPLRRKIKTATTKSPDTLRKNKALRQLAKTTETRQFFRLAGRFIDLWITPNKETDAILAERDTLCFQPDTTELESIPSERRKEILTLLRRFSKHVMMILFFLTAHTLQASTHQARDAWKAGQYEQAIHLYAQAYPDPTHTPADVLYNIGNCQHRLGRTGHAALLWRRALAIDPTHIQARKNLRFVEISEGSQVPNYPDWQTRLTRYPPYFYQVIFYTALWLTVLPLLALICLKPRRKSRTLCITLIIFAPILATLGGLAGHYYPDDHSFAPRDAQAITLEKTTLYTDAHHRENDPRSLPTASLVRINATRGVWTHITTTGDEEGWVESERIRSVWSGGL